MHNANKAFVVLLGALGISACAKDKPAEMVGITETTRAPAQQRAATVEEIRTVLLEKRPGAAAEINAFVIRNDNGIITLRGRVDDEATHTDLVNRVRSMPNVRGVRDEVQVAPKGAPAPEGKQQHGQPTSKSDAVRTSMQQSRPMAESVIDALVITEDGQVVTVAGTVPDETTRQALLRAARETPGVNSVKDHLRVEKPRR